MVEGHTDIAPDLAGRAVFEVAGQLASADTLEELAHRSVAGLHRLIGGDLCVFNVLGSDVQGAVVVGSPADTMAANPHAAELLVTHGHQHPQISGWIDGSVTGPSTISDFLSTAAFHQLELYQGVFRPVAVEDVLTVTLTEPQDGVMRALSVLRGRRSFRAHDRSTMAALRPLVRAAHDRIVARQALQLLATSPVAGPVVVLGPDQEVVEVSRSCQALLEAELGIPCEPGRRLHRRLRDAVDRCALPSSSSSVRIGDLTMTVRVSPDATTALLQVEAPGRAINPSWLRDLGVTPRQTEVLSHLAGGASNTEIARELGISAHTVRKHLENLYAALGVTNRTEAAAVAHRFTSLG